jgi:hypothetical protein
MTDARRLLIQPQLRMPKTPDSLGIKFEGPVLTGKTSVQQKHVREALEAHLKSTQPSEIPVHLRELPVPLPGKK